MDAYLTELIREGKSFAELEALSGENRLYVRNMLLSDSPNFERNVITMVRQYGFTLYEALHRCKYPENYLNVGGFIPKWINELFPYLVQTQEPFRATEVDPKWLWIGLGGLALLLLLKKL